MKLYPIEIEGLFTYPFKQKDLNDLITEFGFKINIEPIWKRLDFDSNGIVTYEDMKKMFTNAIESVK